MSDTVVRVEHLGKKYQLWHSSVGGYITLRSQLSQTARRVTRKMLKRHRIDPKREEFWALKDILFKIKQGDRVGIIGHNGAGKSTLLKILSRITDPTKGRITLTGRVASLLEVGTGFHPELTGREHIYLNGVILGMSKQEIRNKFAQIVRSNLQIKFLCQIDELLLIPGRYRINASLMRHEELIDDVKAAAVFEVEQGKIRGRAVPRESGYGSVLIQHRWITPT